MTTKTETTESAVAVLIPLDKLKKSPRNARRTAHTQAAIEALAASIHAKGMLQNLVVEPELDKEGNETGSYYVSAGEGRRLAQLLRVKRKQIRKDEPVRCVVDAMHDAHEISLDENVTRTSMHPADQFEAFKRLADEQGWGAEEIGARFGVSPQVVRQRMRLGAVSPALMQRYRDGELSLEQLMAFAISEDHARQEQVHEIVQGGWQKTPPTIRRLMMETHVEADDPRAVFVGIDVYEAAGGEVVRDLFTEDGGGFLADVTLLDRLVVEKLEAVATEVKAEGWQWVETHVEFPYDHGMRRVYPQQVELPARDAKRLEKLRAEYEDFDERYDADDEFTEEEEARFAELEVEIQRLLDRQRVFTPEAISRGGAIVTLDRDGAARIERGFVRSEDEQEEESDGFDGDEDRSPVPFPRTGSAEGGDASDGGEPKGKELPDSLVRDLTAHRTLALRLVLGEQPAVALIAMTHALAAEVFYDVAGESCLEVQASVKSLRGDATGIDDTLSGRALSERHESWAAQMPEEVDGLWAFVIDLDDERRMSLFAHCAAATVFAVRQKWERKPGAQESANRLAEAVSLDMAVHWQPTADAYFSRVTKAQIADAVREAASDQEAARIAGMKKQAMAESAERLLAGTGWLPRLLRATAANDESVAESAAA